MRRAAARRGHRGLALELDRGAVVGVGPLRGDLELRRIFDVQGELPRVAAESLEGNGCEISWVHAFGSEQPVGESVRDPVLDFASCVADDDAQQGSPSVNEGGERDNEEYAAS